MTKPYFIQSEHGAVTGPMKTPVMTYIIESFPYPERFCRYCEQQMEICNAIHLKDNEEVFKCIYQCYNDDCESYDEEGNMAYVRVYYSSELALQLYETVFLKIKREFKN